MGTIKLMENTDTTPLEDRYNEVVQKVKAEFEYSQHWDKKRLENNAPESTFDKNKPIESWILYMEHHLGLARYAVSTGTDKHNGLDQVRQVANLALACLTYKGCPERKIKNGGLPIT